MMNSLCGKKGFFFYVEIMLVVILALIIWTQFPISQQTYLDLSAQENLRYLGYTYLKAVDVSGVLPKYINPTNFSATNFTKLKFIVVDSLPSDIIAYTEYIYNETLCYDGSGSAGACGLNTTSADTTAILYTFTNSTEPITIKLYLKNAFGGRL